MRAPALSGEDQPSALCAEAAPSGSETSCERAKAQNDKTNTNAAAKTSVLFIKSFICIFIAC